MYLSAPCLARFFVLCQVYSSSRHLKNAPFAASLADLRHNPACVPRTSTRRYAPRVRHTVNPSTRRSNPARVCLRLVACGQCLKGHRACAPSNFSTKVLLCLGRLLECLKKNAFSL